MRDVRGKAVQLTPHSQFTAKVTSVVTIGKEGLTGAEASRADLILDAFRGYDSLLSSPFVRKIFFPGYSLHTLKWPALPPSQPEINFTYRPLNLSQQRAVEKCLSNKKENRHVVIVVSSSHPLSCLISRLALGSTGDRQDYSNRCRRSQHFCSTRFKHRLGHCTVECRSQERCGEIGRLWFLGLQAPRIERFPFRLVGSSVCVVRLSFDMNRMTSKARTPIRSHPQKRDRIWGLQANAIRERTSVIGGSGYPVHD